MARRRYLDESRPSMEYVRAMINNTDYTIGSPNYGKVNVGAIDVPWNSTPTRRRTTTTKKKNNTKWVPKTKEQALKSLGETKEYTVKSNDTLSKIDSKRWRDIAIANGISDPNKIQVGQKLIIPKDAGALSESAASESTKTENVNTPTPKTTTTNDYYAGSVVNSTHTRDDINVSTTPKSTTKATSANQDYGAAKIGLFTTPNIVPYPSKPTQEKASSKPSQEKSSGNLSARVQNRIAAFRQYAKDNGIDLFKPEEKSAARRGWDAFINSFVPSVNVDPSGGYHAYTNEQFWKDNTGEEMPSALRQTVGQNLKVAGAAAASIGAPAALEALGATVGAPISDAIMATRGGQIVANVLANPYVRAAGTAYGLSRFPFDVRDGDYINAALDVVPFGSEAWNAARSVATGTNMTRAGNWFGFSKNINPGGTRVSNPIEIDTNHRPLYNVLTNKSETAYSSILNRFPRWYLRGKMPIYNPYTRSTEFVNRNILQSQSNYLSELARRLLPYGKERMLEPYPTRNRPLGFRSDVAFISPADNARGILQNMQPRINLPYNGITTPGYTSPANRVYTQAAAEQVTPNVMYGYPTGGTGIFDAPVVELPPTMKLPRANTSGSGVTYGRKWNSASSWTDNRGWNNTRGGKPSTSQRKYPTEVKPEPPKAEVKPETPKRRRGRPRKNESKSKLSLGGAIPLW